MLVSDILLPLDAKNLVAAVDTNVELTTLEETLKTLQVQASRGHKHT